MKNKDKIDVWEVVFIEQFSDELNRTNCYLVEIQVLKKKTNDKTSLVRATLS